MNCVGIDVSKGKSTIAVMRPFGEVVVSPFEVCHTASELSELARLLKSLDGETRVVMESTGNYHAPVAWLLHGAGKSVVFQGIQIGFHRSVVDTQELVGGCHHVDTVWLALRAFLVHELVDRLIDWSALQEDAHHQEKCPAQ